MLIVVLVFFSSLTFSAQNLEGFLLDKESGNPISNVSIILMSNQENLGKSNIDGKFSVIYNNDIDSIIFNTYKLICILKYYKKYKQNIY